MKRPVCLFLLLPIFLQVGGMLLICLLLQLDHSRRIEAIMDNASTNFERFVLTAEEFRKAQKDEREIFLNGKIYDIKEILRHDGTVGIVAYHDSKEEGLISLIENFFDEESPGNDFSLQVLKLLVSVYTFSPLRIEFSQQQSPGTFFNANSCSYISFSGETLSPPPDAVS